MKLVLKESVSFYSQPKVRCREYFEYFLMRQKYEKMIIIINTINSKTLSTNE